MLHLPTLQYFDISVKFVLTLNVPVPYKYGPTNAWNGGSTGLSRTWAALPARFPLASRAFEPRFGGVHATRIPTHAAVPRISTHLRATIPRISMQLEAAVPRISTQLEAVVRWISMALKAMRSHALPRNDKHGSVYSRELTNSRFQCCHGEL